MLVLIHTRPPHAIIPANPALRRPGTRRLTPVARRSSIASPRRSLIPGSRAPLDRRPSSIAIVPSDGREYRSKAQTCAFPVLSILLAFVRGFTPTRDVVVVTEGQFAQSGGGYNRDIGNCQGHAVFDDRRDENGCRPVFDDICCVHQRDERRYNYGADGSV